MCEGKLQGGGTKQSVSLFTKRSKYLFKKKKKRKKKKNKNKKGRQKLKLNGKEKL